MLSIFSNFSLGCFFQKIWCKCLKISEAVRIEHAIRNCFDVSNDTRPKVYEIRKHLTMVMDEKWLMQYQKTSEQETHLKNNSI